MDAGRDAPELSDLIREHYALLYRYGFRLSGSAADAEDLTQQAFLTAHQKLDQLREPERAKAWLCAILRNAFLKSRRPGACGDVCSLECVAEPVDAVGADTQIDAEELQTVLNEMPEEFRTPLILFYFEEFSYKEIAGQMAVPIGTVMSRLARGKSHLRSRLRSRQAIVGPAMDSL